MTATTKIVTVWHDETSGEPAWVVDTDTVGGGESTTVKTFDAKADAVAFAEQYAAKHGLRMEVRS